MQTTDSISPLDTLVMMELGTLRLEQERLLVQLPLLALQPDPGKAQQAFMNQMDCLRAKSVRLERLLESMSSWGSCEDERQTSSRTLATNVNAA